MKGVKILATVTKVTGQTVSVLNTYKTKHPKYQKIIKRTKRYLADNHIGEVKVGDIVEIVGCRPISKNKTFKVSRIVND